ncbi:BspA family leucine-rich repeat surface protein [Segatella copri]|uniref:BspA family leucine-rich repeat surface protein n=1 Tax=Segatella copri TaxID=165179 RepID=UPI00294B0A1D|nr:BspA family leucine-rich repeat surface protein [Segatella copri]WOG04736.1 BspA family leucine-rich repeat surface protein [Segatella copri]
MGRKPAVCTMGGAKFCRFALFPLMLLMLLLLPAGMVAQKAASSSKYIATYESSTQTLTFKKNVGETLPSNSVVVKDRMTVAAINNKLGNGTIVHIVFDKSFSTYTPTTLRAFFSNLLKLETITGLEYLNTEKVTDMNNMFSSCSELTSLDVTHFNTAKVTNMGSMFYSCSKLTSLDVTNFNTANVTNMNYMFSGCSKLTSLDVTKFNTAKVTNMRYMFSSCSKLTSLDVTNFNTEKVTYMNRMFSSCSSLTSLDVTHFNTANVTNMNSMFSSCSSLTSLDVTHFNTANVTDMNGMFSSCSKLTSLDVTYFNTANVTDMSFMFANCSSLTSLDVAHFNTEKVTGMSRMFIGCSALLSLDVTNFNTANVTDMSYMFSDCVALTSLYLTNFNTEKVTNMVSMFAYCRALTTIYASSKFVTTKVTNSSNMFYNCNKLKGEEECTDDKATDKTYAKIEGGYFSRAIPRVKYADGTLTFFLASKETLGENEYELNSGKNLPEWVKHTFSITKVVFDTSFANARPTSCYKWFFWCEKLNQVEGIKNLNTKEVTDMADMFYECRDLSSLDVSGFNTEKVTDMSGMFYECISLKLLDVAKFNTANVKSMSNMFYRCNNLDLLNVTNFNTANVTNMQGMFSGCSALTTIYASDKFVTGKVTDGSNMFSNCINLKGFIDYKNNSDKTDHIYANYKTGYFTKLVGKNGDEKIGATGETLATDNLVLDDDKDFVAYEPFAAKAASYSRTVEGTTWATLCLPFEVSLENQNFRAFKLLSADDVTETVELEEIKTSIAAGTPVIIKMKDGATKLNFTVANMEIANEVKTAETANGNYQLQGIYTQKMFSQDADNNCYIVKGDKLMNPAKLLDKTTTEHVGSKPFRAYMVDNSSAPVAGARMFSISVGGSTTAIEQLETTADSKAEYYDLQGRRLQDLQKGINIVKRGGKTMKVIIK